MKGQHRRFADLRAPPVDSSASAAGNVSQDGQGRRAWSIAINVQHLAVGDTVVHLIGDLVDEAAAAMQQNPNRPTVADANTIDREPRGSQSNRHQWR